MLLIALFVRNFLKDRFFDYPVFLLFLSSFTSSSTNFFYLLFLKGFFSLSPYRPVFQLCFFLDRFRLILRYSLKDPFFSCFFYVGFSIIFFVFFHFSCHKLTIVLQHFFLCFFFYKTECLPGKSQVFPFYSFFYALLLRFLFYFLFIFFFQLLANSA